MNYKNILISISVILFSLILVSGCDEEATAPQNNGPIITSINAFPSSIQLSDSFAVICSAYDPDGDSLFYDWFCTSGASIKGAHPGSQFVLYNTTENIRVFYAPDSIITQIDSIRIDCDVRDGKGGVKSAWVYVRIIE